MRSILRMVFAAVAGIALADPAALAQGTEFAVGSIKASRGERASGYLEVPAIAGRDEGTRIPVTVIHGAKPGPVLALIAGTHGYEYAPILAMMRLPAQVDAWELSGTLLIVHVANLPSFLGRTIYYSPVDGKNLNRVYPGRADGTLSERIAAVITKEIIDRADYVADLHCGDGNESLRPYTYWMTSGSAAVNEKSREMALAFGLDHIVIDRERSSDPAMSVYTANTAITRGKPAITTETGELGRVDDEGPELALAGALNLMRHLRMLPGTPRRAEHPLWIDRNEVLRSPATGVFHARVRRGYTVARGALLGVLTDYFGNTLEEIRAPFSGIILYVVATPPVSRGEPLAMVGQIQQDAKD